MFALRALVSTLTRLPTGALTLVFSSRRIIVAALTLAMLVAFAIPQTASSVMLTTLLAIEGVAFGMFLTSGQAFVTENSHQFSRGAAMGLYNTAGSVGTTVGSFALGVVAEAFGPGAVFSSVGAIVFVGLTLVVYVMFRQQRIQLAVPMA